MVSPGGHLLEISNGSEVKRMPVFQELAPMMTISASKIELSGLATLINILRSGLKSRPLSEASKHPKLLTYALNEIAIRQMEDDN